MFWGRVESMVTAFIVRPECLPRGVDVARAYDDPQAVDTVPIVY